MIGINNFVLRQTPESEFSHFIGSWETLALMVEKNFPKAKEGYREGVKLVPMPPELFKSGIVDLREVKEPVAYLFADFKARRDGEEPYLQVACLDNKQRAKYVHVVVYHKDVLGKDASTDKEWEIVSINASLVKDEPMHPVTMARNQLGLEGGTVGSYSPEDFARAVLFWSQHAHCK